MHIILQYSSVIPLTTFSTFKSRCVGTKHESILLEDIKIGWIFGLSLSSIKCKHRSSVR